MTRRKEKKNPSVSVFDCGFFTLGNHCWTRFLFIFSLRTSLTLCANLTTVVINYILNCHYARKKEKNVNAEDKVLFRENNKLNHPGNNIVGLRIGRDMDRLGVFLFNFDTDDEQSGRYNKWRGCSWIWRRKPSVYFGENTWCLLERKRTFTAETPDTGPE